MSRTSAGEYKPVSVNQLLSDLVSVFNYQPSAAHIDFEVSLNAADDDTRTRLMPINRRYPLAELMAACKRYPLPPRRKITFEYILMKGVNDSMADARRLIKLLRPVKAKINLIPFNEWPGAPYKRSTDERIKSFANIIYKAGYASPIRTPRGEDIMAACGQLKSATERARKSRKQIAAEAGLAGE